MAVQPMPAVPHASHGYGSYWRTAEQVEETDPWSLPSSQETTKSNASLPLSNKRTLTFDEDEDEDEEEDFGDPFSLQQRNAYPFSHTRMPDLNSLLPSPTPNHLGSGKIATPRAFAIPRSRFPINKEKKPALEGQENLGLTPKALLVPSTVTTGNPQGVDFEDAEFLIARESTDTDDVMEGC
jgi:hypothetical protein